MVNKVQLKFIRSFVTQMLPLGICLAVEPAAYAQPSKKKEPTLERNLIQGNIAVSEWFDEVAEGLDLFLVGRRITRKRNETFVRIENSTFFKEYNEARNETNINANVRLPNFEQYWQLKFTTYDEIRESRRVNTGYLRRSPRERNVGATVGLFKRLGAVRTTFQPRIELRDPLKVSHSLAFESVADFKAYRINPKLEFFAYADRGVGVFQALNFNFQLSKIFSLTLINQGEYEEKLNKYSVTNGFSVGHALTEKKALSYNLFFLSTSRMVYHLSLYNVGVTWSEVLYKRILDYQITPYLEFDEFQGFRGIPGITFDLNLTF